MTLAKDNIICTGYNSTYPKGGVLCSKDGFVVNQTLVFQIKFCGKSPALRVAAKRWWQFKKMKLGEIFILGLFLISCGQVSNSEDHKVQTDTVDTSDIKNEETKTIPTIALKMTDLQEKVFEMGSVTHFTDTCSFYFECDCCSGDLIINNNGTFYYVDHCMSDQTVRIGKYSMTDKVITFDFGSNCVSKVYNYENEIDRLK